MKGTIVISLEVRGSQLALLKTPDNYLRLFLRHIGQPHEPVATFEPGQYLDARARFDKEAAKLQEPRC